jgi:hypothetical protein
VSVLSYFLFSEHAMASTDNASPTIGDGVVMRPRRRNTGTYGHWLQPIINTNDQASTATAEPQPLPAPTPSGRGRGRPRVNKVVRDASAIEVNNRQSIRAVLSMLNVRRNVARKYEKLSVLIKSVKTRRQRQTSDEPTSFCKFSPTSPLTLRRFCKQPPRQA